MRQPPHFWVRTERDRDEAASVELRFRAVLLPCSVADAADTRSRLLDEGDAVEQVRDEGVPSDARLPQVGQGQALWQVAGTDHLDPVRVDLHEHVCAVEEPVAMHDRVGDRFAHGLHRVLGNVLAPQALDSVRGARVALDEAHGVFDVGHNAAVKVLAVQDVDLVGTPPQQAGDVRFRKEAAHVLGEEKHAGVAEEQLLPRPLGDLDVHQDVLHRRTSGDARLAEPSIELLAVEVLGIFEARARRQIEPDHAFGPKEVADFVAAHLLRDGALPPEEAIAALHRLGVAFPHVDHEDPVHRLHQHLHRRIAVASDVLHSGTQRIGVLDADHAAVVAHAQEDLSADRVGHRNDPPRKRLRQSLLELQRGSLALLDEDIQIGRVHGVGGPFPTIRRPCRLRDATPSTPPPPRPPLLLGRNHTSHRSPAMRSERAIGI